MSILYFLQFYNCVFINSLAIAALLALLVTVAHTLGKISGKKAVVKQRGIDRSAVIGLKQIAYRAQMFAVHIGIQHANGRTVDTGGKLGRREQSLVKMHILGTHVVGVLHEGVLLTPLFKYSQQVPL